MMLSVGSVVRPGEILWYRQAAEQLAKIVKPRQIGT
jgi:hypothetical protein